MLRYNKHQCVKVIQMHNHNYLHGKVQVSMCGGGRGREGEGGRPTEGAEAQGAGVRGPLQVAHRVHAGHMLTTGSLP